MKSSDIIRRTLYQPLILLCLVFSTAMSSAQLTTDPDINDDGVVNFIDFVFVRDCFPSQPILPGDPCASSDFNGDGNVNSADVTIIVDNFFQAFPTPAEAASLFPRVIPVDDSHELAQIADVNGDGFPDVITTSTENDQVNVKFGSESEDYESSFTFDALNSGSVSVVDINRDTIVDLIVAEPVNGIVRSYYGDGSNQFFDSQVTNSVDGSPTHMIVADLNADQLADLVVYAISGNSISVLLANPAPAGGFLPQISIPTENLLGSVNVEEFTGDGVPDLLVVDTVGAGSRASVFTGTGNGLFVPGAPQNIDVTMPVVVGDFDGDGDQDYVAIRGNTLSSQSANLKLWKNSGDGTFTGVSVSVDGLLRYPGRAMTGNLNNDEYADLVLEQGQDRSLFLFTGGDNGDFSFEKGLAVSGAMVGADLNGDDLDDIAIQTEDGIRLIKGGTSGEFDAPLAQLSGNNISRSDYIGLHQADFNNDGLVDLVTSSCFYQPFIPGCDFSSRPVATISLADVNGGFTSVDSVQYPDLVGSPIVTATGDYNGDNNIDLMVGQGGFFGGGLKVYPGQGNGELGPVGQIPYTIAEIYGVSFADLNNDQFDDFLFSQFNYLTNEYEIKVALSAGDGSFDTASVPTMSEGLGSVLVDDYLNNDGNVDLVTLGGELYSGNGTGEFVNTGTLNPGQPSWYIVADDFNGDGTEDLISRVQNTLTLFLGLESGGFGPPFALPETVLPENVSGALRSGDLNNDGKIDLAIAADRQVVIVLGNGDGSFQQGVAAYPGLLVDFLELMDVNQDGRDDLVTVEISNEWLSILQVRTPDE